MMTLQPTVSSRLRQLVSSCCARACLQLLLPEKSVLTLLIRHPKPRPADRHTIAFVSERAKDPAEAIGCFAKIAASRTGLVDVPDYDPCVGDAVGSDTWGGGGADKAKVAG